MSINTHIQSLHEKHKRLEQELHQAYMHHLPVTEIKKEKLQIKDEIEGLLKHTESGSYSEAA